MPEYNSIHRLFIITAALMLFSKSHAQAEPRAFCGVITSIIADKSCPKKLENQEITLVFDGESTSAGWLYSKWMSAAELKRISPTHFEVTNAVTRFNKLPPTSMDLLQTKEGMHVVVRDHIPEDKEIRESTCFFEKMEVTLKPSKETASTIIERAKLLFAVDLIMLEGSDLLFKHNEYRKAEVQGNKALKIYENLYGKWSKESINAAGLIAFSLMKLDRFDEAQEVIANYRKALPDDSLLKEFEVKILELLKEQNDLFRYDPDSKSDTDLEPLG